jgi:hypothetical protein
MRTEKKMRCDWKPGHFTDSRDGAQGLYSASRLVALCLSKALFPAGDKFQRGEIAAVARGALPDALQRLKLSRSRSTFEGAPRVARRIATASPARLHHAVSFSAAVVGRRRRARAERNRASAGSTQAPAHFCSHRRYGALRQFRQHFLYTTPGTTCRRKLARCLRTRSLTPKPITNTFRQRVGARVSFRRGVGVS